MFFEIVLKKCLVTDSLDAGLSEPGRALPPSQISGGGGAGYVHHMTTNTPPPSFQDFQIFTLIWFDVVTIYPNSDPLTIKD